MQQQEIEARDRGRADAPSDRPPPEASSSIRVLLVEDHTALRQALSIVLRMQPDMVVAGQAGSLAEACTMLEDVDVAILDLDLEDGNGLDLLPDLRRTRPQAAALILTASKSKEDAAQAIARGAAGVLHKSIELEAIAKAVRMAASGELLLPPEDGIELVRLAGKERDRSGQAAEDIVPLTPRELDVLSALAQGLSDKEIAAQLHVSHETVRTHMVNLLGKLGAHSRLHALVVAVRHGLVEIR